MVANNLIIRSLFGLKQCTVDSVHPEDEISVLANDTPMWYISWCHVFPWHAVMMSLWDHYAGLWWCALLEVSMLAIGVFNMLSQTGRGGPASCLHFHSADWTQGIMHVQHLMNSCSDDVLLIDANNVHNIFVLWLLRCTQIYLHTEFCVQSWILNQTRRTSASWVFINFFFFVRDTKST